MLNRDRRATLVVFGCILVMSLVLVTYALHVQTPLRYADERQYAELAASIKNGTGFALNGHPTAWRPPAWPVVLAAFLLIGVPANYLVVAPIGIMIAGAFVAAIIGARLSVSPWGGLAGVVVLAYPLNVYVASTLYPQAFATLLVLLLWLIVLLIYDRRTADIKRILPLFLVLGFLASTLSLSVPVLAFTALAVLGWVTLKLQMGRTLGAVCATIGYVIPIGIWAIRNYFIFHAFIPLSTSGGYNLLVGNNPTATASSGMDIDISAAMDRGSTMSEPARDEFYRSAAVDWIVGHPADAVCLYFGKWGNYFMPYNTTVTPSDSADAQQLIAYVSFALIVVVVSARFLLRRFKPLASTELLFLSLFAVNSIVMAVFFTRVRFRQPLDSILLVEAGIAIVLIVSVIRANWPRSIPVDRRRKPAKPLSDSELI